MIKISTLEQQSLVNPAVIQQRDFCFVFLRVLVTSFPEHGKYFRRKPPQTQHFLFLRHTYAKKILEQSIADDYSREVVLFLDRAMLSDQAEAAAEGNLQLPEGAAFFPLHNLRRSECHRSAVRLMLGR